MLSFSEILTLVHTFNKFVIKKIQINFQLGLANNIILLRVITCGLRNAGSNIEKTLFFRSKLALYIHQYDLYQEQHNQRFSFFATFMERLIFYFKTSISFRQLSFHSTKIYYRLSFFFEVY